MTRERWMALCFASGSTCFLIGPFPGYASLVGDGADAVTFFAGSVLFTAGGALQSSVAFPDRRGELEHLARRRVFFGVRSCDNLHWPHIEVAASTTSS